MIKRFYTAFTIYIMLSRCIIYIKVGGEGFEPSKAVPADLQSVPFGHSGIHPFIIGRHNESYLPTKLFEVYHTYQFIASLFLYFYIFSIYFMHSPVCIHIAAACKHTESPG